MSFVAVAIGGSAALGALASNAAANKQSKAAGAAGQLAADQYYTTRSDLAPWVTTGGKANSALDVLMGLGGGTQNLVERNAQGVPIPNAQLYLSDPSYRSAWDNALQSHVSKYGEGYGNWSDTGSIENSIKSGSGFGGGQFGAYTPSGQTSGPGGLNAGYLLQNFTGQDLENEPGYQFGLSEGEKSINRSAAGRGSYDSGATLKALQRYSQDYAGTKFNEGYNRDAGNKSRIYGMLSGQSGQGLQAAGQLGAMGANAAGAQGNALMQGADASAAGLMGGANAIAGGANNYLGYQNNQATLDYLKGLRGASAVGAGAAGTPFGYSWGK